MHCAHTAAFTGLIAREHLTVLARTLGGYNSAVLFLHLEFWFARKPDRYYKFLSPCDHPLCRPGDSWTEELAFSEHDFRKAFDALGNRYNSIGDLRETQKRTNPFHGKLYVSVVDRTTNVTYYFRNHFAVRALLKSAGLGEFVLPRRESGFEPDFSLPAPVSDPEPTEFTPALAEPTTSCLPITEHEPSSDTDDLLYNFEIPLNTEKQFKNLNNNENKKYIKLDVSVPNPPASDTEVIEYFAADNRTPDVARRFLKYYNRSQWHTSTGFPVQNWKDAADRWTNHVPTSTATTQPPSDGRRIFRKSDLIAVLERRGLTNPSEEAKRFVEFYRERNWMSSNGFKINNPLATAEFWKPKKTCDRPKPRAEKLKFDDFGAPVNLFPNDWKEGYYLKLQPYQKVQYEAHLKSLGFSSGLSKTPARIRFFLKDPSDLRVPRIARKPPSDDNDFGNLKPLLDKHVQMREISVLTAVPNQVVRSASSSSNLGEHDWPF